MQGHLAFTTMMVVPGQCFKTMGYILRDSGCRFVFTEYSHHPAPPPLLAAPRLPVRQMQTKVLFPEKSEGPKEVLVADGQRARENRNVAPLLVFCDSEGVRGARCGVLISVDLNLFLRVPMVVHVWVARGEGEGGTHEAKIVGRL